MAPDQEDVYLTAAALAASARRARAEAMHSLLARLLRRLSWRRLLKPDESLGRPDSFGRAQWG